MTSRSAGHPPSTGLAGAILSTIFWCLPFGIVAIVHAARVDSAWYAGDHTRAHEESEKAKNWTIAAVVTGLIVAVLYFCANLSGAPQ